MEDNKKGMKIVNDNKIKFKNKVDTFAQNNNNNCNIISNKNIIKKNKSNLNY